MIFPLSPDVEAASTLAAAFWPSPWVRDASQTAKLALSFRKIRPINSWIAQPLRFGPMSKANHEVKYLLFDVESIADGEMIARTRYPNAGYTPDRAVAMFRQDLLCESGRDFIPFTYHLPIALVIAKIREDFSLIEIVSLDEPQHRPEIISKQFWLGWERYGRPTWITFNGRTFDLPLMELAAYRFGISVPDWFNLNDRTYSQHRNRYNLDSHLDLHEVLTNFGSTWFRGGLNLAAILLEKPGKLDIHGDMVFDMYQAGKHSEISEYCRCDVLDTYFVFLRLQVMMGKITNDRERELIESTRSMLLQQSDKHIGYQRYLEAWSTPT